MLRELPRFEWRELDTKGNAWSWLFYLFHVLPIACLALVAARWRRCTPDAWPRETVAVAAIAIMALPVNFGFLRHSLDGRIPDGVVLPGLLGAWLLGGAVRSRWPGRALVRCVAATVVVVTIAEVVRAADVREQLGRMGVLSRPEAVWQRAENLWRRLGRRLPEGDQIPSRYSGSILPFIEYREPTSR